MGIYESMMPALPEAKRNAGEGLVAALLVSDEYLLEELRAALQHAGVTIAFGAGGPPAEGDRPRLLRSTQPDVLFAQLDAVQSPAEVIDALRLASPGVPIAIVQRHAEAEVVLECFRAGATEYLHLPLTGVLDAALRRLAAARRQRPAAALGSAIGFLSVKGGCGATTVACHVAHAVKLARPGDETLLADFDPTSGLVAFIAGLTPKYNFLDALGNTHRLDRSFWDSLVVRWQGLEVIAAPGTPPGPELWAGTGMREVLHLARSRYRWVIADLGRGLDPFTLDTIQALDQLVLVTTVNITALARAALVLRHLRDTGSAPARLGLLVNRRPKDSELSNREIEESVGLPVLTSVPLMPQELPEGSMDAGLLPASSRLGQCFAEIARKLTRTEDQSGTPRISWLNRLKRGREAGDCARLAAPGLEPVH